VVMCPCSPNKAPAYRTLRVPIIGWGWVGFCFVAVLVWCGGGCFGVGLGSWWWGCVWFLGVSISKAASF